MTTQFLLPVLALTCWTLIIWIWMYATRIPAMQAAKIDPQEARHPGSLNTLPSKTRAIADNYNHLHEQPTVFYALMFYSYLTGLSGHQNLAFSLAWVYVGLRIAHSLVQTTVNIVMLRFVIFLCSSLVLIGLAALNVLALL